MKRIKLEVSDEVAVSLAELAARCRAEHLRRDGFTSHGELNTQTLISMLIEDAAMIVTRPGSWEASNMTQVFSSHGYEV